MAKSIKVFVNIKKIKKGEKMIISSVFALYTHTRERNHNYTKVLRQTCPIVLRSFL